MTNKKILIVDDSEINRALLIDMLEDQYEVEEAVDGEDAINILRRRAAEFSLILLDIVMPQVDGFAVLEYMDKYRILDSTAVIMISSDDSYENIRKAYEMGAFDYISRPFDSTIVRHRVSNTMLLYMKQHRLEDIVVEQIYEQQKNNKIMISILSHIVEFRNGESGRHVVNVENITELLLMKLIKLTDRYSLKPVDIELISTASVLHDIGKISVPDGILNKPGRLTTEEFEIMKRHTVIGADMLNQLSAEDREEQLVKTAFEICRWHHERYDGGGYPDGLKGDEIPISAQVVAMADVYDALTSDRCYKKAYSNEEAVQMILNGECGAFNPILLECLKEIGDPKKKISDKNTVYDFEAQTIQSVRDKLNNYELVLSKKNIDNLRFEQQKSGFFSDVSADILFSYNNETALLTLNTYGAKKLGFKENIFEPEKNSRFQEIFDQKDIRQLAEEISATSPNNPSVNLNVMLCLDGEALYYNCVVRTVWTSDVESKQIGFVGVLIEVNREQLSDYNEENIVK